MVIIGAALFASFLITSCGGKKADEKSGDAEKKEQAQAGPQVLGKVNYSEFKISNRDKAYFKMVDGGSTEIVLTEDGGIEVTGEFELIKPFTGKLGQYETEQAFVSLVALDKDGNTIPMFSVTNGEMRNNDSEGSQFADFLRGEPGSKVKFVFSGESQNVDFENVKGGVMSDEGKKLLREASTKDGKLIVGFTVVTQDINY